MNTTLKPHRDTYNIPLFLSICESILKEPLQFDMSNYFDDYGIRYVYERNEEERVRMPVPNCGTTACIAGWAIANNLKLNPAKACKKATGIIDYNARHRIIDYNARQALGINKYESNLLFYRTNWPREFYDSNYDYLTPTEQAEIAVKRIHHFIETGL